MELDMFEDDVKRSMQASTNPEDYKRHVKIYGDTSNADFEDINQQHRNAVPTGAELERLTKIVHFLDERKCKTFKDLEKGMQAVRKVHRGPGFRKSQLLHVYNALVEAKTLEPSPLGGLLVKKQGKSQSGVLVITVLTSPYPAYTKENGKKVTQRFTCKWNCYYCPNEPGQPRSYLHDEPSVLRANRNNFDPVLQFHDRAMMLEMNGHPVDKVELLVLGGTWSSYPHAYQAEFIRDIFYAANTFFERKANKKDLREPLSLAEEKFINETTRVKIIGVTLETRPDCIDGDEIRRLRSYGCTRVQLGVQHTDDYILTLINRECSTERTMEALELLRNCCYKMDIHLMPNLPGASPEIDNKMFEMVLNDHRLQADQWKIYPTEITPWTVIKTWFETGRHVPYGGDLLEEVIIRVKSKVHPWIRLNRVVRDIPSQYVVGPVDDSNLRQKIARKMAGRGLYCKCIRCREVRGDRSKISPPELVVREYRAGAGTEYFISFETVDRKRIYGFLRLRICDDPLMAGSGVYSTMQHCALIRELHVYGPMKATYAEINKSKVDVQHVGLGRQLMDHAVVIAKQHNYSKMCVIAGVGVRNFYRKIGYVYDPESEMMMLDLDNPLTRISRYVTLFAVFAVIIIAIWMEFMQAIS